MLVAFAHRSPDQGEIQQLRLILSTYQDGFGMLDSGSLPGWRDFERAVAAVFGGEAPESKAIFDVLVPDTGREGVNYGLACKMRSTLQADLRVGRVTVEVSNAQKKFWDRLNSKGITEADYRERPAEVGASLIEVVEGWHSNVSLEKGGGVDVAKSFYLILLWDKSTKRYRLYQFDISLPDPSTVTWDFPRAQDGGPSKRLVGKDGAGKLFEWYGQSGGQLKYYPLMASARWVSDPFSLEPLPDLPEVEDRLIKKAELYFGDLWFSARRR